MSGAGFGGWSLAALLPCTVPQFPFSGSDSVLLSGWAGSWDCRSMGVGGLSCDFRLGRLLRLSSILIFISSASFGKIMGGRHVGRFDRVLFLLCSPWEYLFGRKCGLGL